MEAGQASRGLLRAFDGLEDPRVERTKRHSLNDILTITVMAVICGADGFVQIAMFGRSKCQWLKTFLELPNGIPSHDTFGRVLSALDPQQFERCIVQWTAALAKVTRGQLVAIDGKTLRRSFQAAGGKAAIHMVNAWCSSNRMALGQLATEQKSNEITAVPKLLELLDLDGAIVTVDAMNCQKETAGKIIAGGGDYVMQVKGNQQKLHEQLIVDLDEAVRLNFQGMEHDSMETVDGDHGRIETRRLWCMSDVSWVPNQEQWPARPASSDGTLSRRCRPMPGSCCRRCGATGAWKTVCTGAWTCRSGRTSAASEPVTGPRTSRACAGCR